MPDDKKQMQLEHFHKERIIEKRYLPESANVPPNWIDANSPAGFWHIQYPSKKQPGIFYTLKINLDTRQITCNCPAFRGIEDSFIGLGICSHVKKFGWVVKTGTKNTAFVSLQAKLAHSEEWLNEKSLEVLKIIAEHPHTCDEVEVIAGLKHQTCSPIILGLVKNGWLEDSGDMRPTRSGPRYMAIVWQTT